MHKLRRIGNAGRVEVRSSTRPSVDRNAPVSGKPGRHEPETGTSPATTCLPIRSGNAVPSSSISLALLPLPSAPRLLFPTSPSLCFASPPTKVSSRPKRFSAERRDLLWLLHLHLVLPLSPPCHPQKRHPKGSAFPCPLPLVSPPLAPRPYSLVSPCGKLCQEVILKIFYKQHIPKGIWLNDILGINSLNLLRLIHKQKRG